MSRQCESNPLRRAFAADVLRTFGQACDKHRRCSLAWLDSVALHEHFHKPHKQNIIVLDDSKVSLILDIGHSHVCTSVGITSLVQRQAVDAVRWPSLIMQHVITQTTQTKTALFQMTVKVTLTLDFGQRIPIVAFSIMYIGHSQTVNVYLVQIDFEYCLRRFSCVVTVVIINISFTF